MRGRTYPALLLLLLSACAQDGPSRLDGELASFKAEQQAYRLEELEATYLEDRQRAEDLTHAILTLRQEIRQLEADLAALEARKGELDRELAREREPATE